MRLDTPRVPPLPEEEMPEEFRGLMGSGPTLNIFRTLAHHPLLLKRWLGFGTHLLTHSSLPAREREIAILRVGWLCRSGYEWGQHAVIGREAGLADAEIARIAEGPDAAGWSDLERAVLRATDELHADAFVSDPTWQALAAQLSTEQLLDFVFTVGQYTLVSMALNTFGVQPEPGLPRMPGR